MDKAYTESELQNIVAQKLASQRMEDMQRMIDDNKKDVINGFAEIRTQLTGLTSMIEKNNKERDQAMTEFRRDVHNDFATKAEVSSDFEKLNTKIDTQWSKLVLIVSVASFIGTIIGGLISIMFKLHGGG